MKPTLKSWIGLAFALTLGALALPSPALAGSASAYGIDNNPAADRLVDACAAQFQAYMDGSMYGQPPQANRQDKIIILGSYINSTLQMTQADAQARLPAMRGNTGGGDPFAAINNALVLCLVEHAADPTRRSNGYADNSSTAPPANDAPPAFQGNGPLKNRVKEIHFAGSEATSCLVPTYGPGANAWTQLVNKCAYPVEAAWCVMGYDCNPGYPGTAPVQPGGSVQVKGGVDGSGRHLQLRFNACKGMGSLELWDEPGFDYHCIMTNPDGSPLRASQIKK